MSEPSWHVHLGEECFREEVQHVHVDSQKEPRTNPTVVTIRSNHFDQRSVDYIDGVTVDREAGGQSQRKFTGSIRRASIGATSVVLSCENGLELELLRSDMFGYVNAGVDLVYSLLKGAEYGDDDLDIEGLDRLPLEQFVVVTPISGIETPSDPIDLGGIYLLGPAVVDELLGGLLDRLDPSGKSKIKKYQAYAVTRIHSFTAHDAQHEAIRRIDRAIALLVVTSRFSYSLLPAGLVAGFNRNSIAFRCRREDVVALRGLTTGRAWLRSAAERLSERSLRANEPPLSYFTRLGAADPVRLDLVILFAARAAQIDEPIERVTTLWQALEFYASSARVPQLFSDDERNKIKDMLRKNTRSELSEEQWKRIADFIGEINQPPLMRRLVEQIKIDGVPVSENEMRLLGILRTFRNSVNHGKPATFPTKQQIDKGVALVARMVLYAGAVSPGPVVGV